jgi:L-rhamnose isomerase
MTPKKSRQEFEFAVERYSEAGVDVEGALNRLLSLPISIHCWQGDDVSGFENFAGGLTGGIAVTGQYPGKARSPEELRQDLEKAFSLIPGKHRLNLHASYGEFQGQKVDRDEIETMHFQTWVQWAKSMGIGLDFNPTFFSHRFSESGFTLSHPDRAIRNFWIEHGKRSREIGAYFGKLLNNACITNVWIPDGFKDTPVDRSKPRERLTESLDAIFKKTLSTQHNLDSVEPKLFGLGSESYVVGSHEFYLGYAISRRKLLCLDSGHFHPTESIADKISSTLPYLPGLLLHVSRGVRWDSDHVVTLTDDLQLISDEIVQTREPERIHIGLDFFDATINRVAAWVLGVRNMQKALLRSLLRPWAHLQKLENEGDLTGRLAFQEESKTFPIGAVWEHFCATHGVPAGPAWLDEVRRYEHDILAKRDDSSKSDS